MKEKSSRLNTIREIVSRQKIGSQEELLTVLTEHGYSLTQATLSRDLKRLKITKTLDSTGAYQYKLSEPPFLNGGGGEVQIIGANSLEFSGNIAVMKTRKGYASGIAAEIDDEGGDAILGTIAGDDTILIIPREGYSRAEITALLSNLIGTN
ncbi:MAG: hypothetical protein J6Z12_06795 [Paludibacteraceae bacterium]|nr:hypothetical protein [Paludibacteraceae bacterium]